MFLTDVWGFSTFVSGFLIGAGFLVLMRRFFSSPLYFRKVWAIWKLFVLFLKELLLSSIAVLRQVLSPRLHMRPGIFTVQTELRSDGEITLLACLITLTPGTLTMEVSPDQSTLYIHAIDIEDAEELADQIKGSFERAIMEVTRS